MNYPQDVNHEKTFNNNFITVENSKCTPKTTIYSNEWIARFLDGDFGLLKPKACKFALKRSRLITPSQMTELLINKVILMCTICILSEHAFSTVHSTCRMLEDEDNNGLPDFVETWLAKDPQRLTLNY